MSSSPTKRRFARDASGVSAIEFALVAPALFGLLYAICQIGLYMYFSASLAHATSGASRKIMTGAVAQSANISGDLFRANVLCPLLPGAMSCDRLVTNIVTVPASGSFANVPAPVMDNKKTSFNIGGGGCYVIVQAYYAMPVIGLPAFLSGAVSYEGTPSVWINANDVFVNEPFSSGASGC